jgi:hypothetical protein
VDRLAFQTVEKTPAIELSARDLKAVEQIVSWEVLPSFAKPGRTAWYVLQDPIQPKGGGALLLSAKLKGVGAWNPSDPNVPSGIRGLHPSGTVPPSDIEYEETARTVHFGVDGEGKFKGVHSEPAPFGSILLRRAAQEYDNARALVAAGAPSIAPYALYRYERSGFNREPLGAVVCLAPDESPFSLDFLYQSEPNASQDRRAHFRSVLRTLQLQDSLDQRTLLAAQCIISHKVGCGLRRFAQAGLYRYSSAWDNFYLNKLGCEVYFTDLDSSRSLDELSEKIAGLQILRDLAGALWRLPKQYSERDSLSQFQLDAVVEADPLASTVAGFFGISDVSARALAAPLWDYVIPHWYLLKRHSETAAAWPKSTLKTYRIDKGIFHCAAILAMAPIYRNRSRLLGLPEIPDQDQILTNVKEFLGEQADYILWLLRSTGSAR